MHLWQNIHAVIGRCGGLFGFVLAANSCRWQMRKATSINLQLFSYSWYNLSALYLEVQVC